jgi:RimJ/RimL family protein N-acetyltransferase
MTTVWQPVGVADDSLLGCELWTPRLVVADWHELADRFRLDLAEIVGHILTPTTTAELPPAWQGRYDDERAAAWIDERDQESPTLLAVERRTGAAVGLLILFDSRSGTHDEPTDVRVGYVIAEQAWGRGLASELVGALVAWGRSQPSIGSMSAGVSEGNDASARVLLKNGFHQVAVQNRKRMYRTPLDA